MEPPGAAFPGSNMDRDAQQARAKDRTNLSHTSKTEYFKF